VRIAAVAALVGRPPVDVAVVRLPPTVVAQPVKPALPFNYGPVWVGLLLAAALGAIVLGARKPKISIRRGT
jgi:hypothetical protein